MTRVYKLKEQEKDDRDLKFKVGLLTRLIRKITTPRVIDLSPLMPPVFDQGQLGSCSANSTVSLLMYNLFYKQNMQPKDYIVLSRLFQYYKTREIEGTIGEDSGATNRDAMKSLNKNGVCEESFMPYDISKFATLPSQQSLVNALTHKLNTYHSVTNLNDVFQALAQGLPVVIGMKVYDSFESEEVAKTGILPMPKHSENMLGGHSVLVVGKDDNTKRLKVRNSWGSSWGQNGYFYMFYDFFNKYTFDYWVGVK